MGVREDNGGREYSRNGAANLYSRIPIDFCRFQLDLAWTGIFADEIFTAVEFFVGHATEEGRFSLVWRTRWRGGKVWLHVTGTKCRNYRN